MKSKITVITSLVGSSDPLRDDQNTEGAEFMAFVDHPWNSKSWKERPAYSSFKSPRRNSRAPKIIPHQFVDTEYSLWIDGCAALRVPAVRLVDEWLKGHDIAVFKHHSRECLYDEATVCAQRKLDDPDVINEQALKYRNRGYPARRGLGECTIIMRRHTEAVERLNNCWWSEFCRHSVRDQISFMYCAWMVNVEVNLITPGKNSHPYISIVERLAGVESYQK